MKIGLLSLEYDYDELCEDCNFNIDADGDIGVGADGTVYVFRAMDGGREIWVDESGAEYLRQAAQGRAENRKEQL